jgi:hypothetical protein
MGKIEKFQISKITYKESFYDISRDLGVSDSEIEKAFELAVFWETQGYLEVYEKDADRQYGRVKKSWIKGDSNVVSAYKGLYHASVSEHTDPLLIIALPWDLGTVPRSKMIEMYFMINHDDIFGERTQFALPKGHLRNIYLRISELRDKP